MKEAIKQESDELVHLLLQNGFNLNMFLNYKNLFDLYHDYFKSSETVYLEVYNLCLK